MRASTGHEPMRERGADALGEGRRLIQQEKSREKREKSIFAVHPLQGRSEINAFGREGSHQSFTSAPKTEKT